MIQIALQGIHDYETSTIKAFEVLARLYLGDCLKSPPGFMVGQPDEAWIELDQIVLNAIRSAKGLTLSFEPLFINVSTATLCSNVSFVKYLVELEKLVKERSGLTIVEIPELLDMSELQLAARLRHLRSIGVGVALDDYGSGRANLDRLVSHEWDVCKIERDAILDVQTREECFLALDLCVRSKTRVIIERVNRSSMPLELIRGHEGLWVQGYDWSRPAIYPATDETASQDRRYG